MELVINTKYRPSRFASALHYNFTISIGCKRAPNSTSEIDHIRIEDVFAQTHTHTHTYPRTKSLSSSPFEEGTEQGAHLYLIDLII